jgi:DNA-binding IclR family transcriptional regulator
MTPPIASPASAELRIVPPQSSRSRPGGRCLDPEHPGRFSSSLAAGLSMLACFSSEYPVRGIADMAADLQFGRSTAHRYATTLVALGYLEQGPSRKYQLAPRASDVALSLFDSMAVRRVAREHLKQLRAQTGHTASLGVLREGEVIYVDRWCGFRQGQYAIDVGIGLGTRVPVHCSAAGKVLLACLPAAEQLKLISMPRVGRRGPTKEVLRAELEQIAAGGVAVEDEELIGGRRALAAAVVDGEGRPVAAVELAVPRQACAAEQLVEKFGSGVIAATRGIASGLGVIDAGGGTV